MRRKSNKSSSNGKEKVADNDSNPESLTSGSEQEYEVESIVDRRTKRGKTEYLVRWKGFSSNDDTWEASTQLNCPELIEAYEKNEKDDDEPLSIQASKKGGKRGRPKKTLPVKMKKPKLSGDENAEYEVSKIIEVQIKKNGEREFLVRWKGYSKSDDTWEPESNLSCNELIETFMEKVAKAKETTGRETRVSRKVTDRYVVPSPERGRKLSGRTRGPRRTYYEEN